MKLIESLDAWLSLAAELREDEYAIWQMQYAANQPEGLHVWFWASDRPDIEIVTHDNAVQKAILKYKYK